MRLQKFELDMLWKEVYNFPIYSRDEKWSFFDIRNSLSCGKFKTREFWFLDPMKIEPMAVYLFWKNIRKKNALKGKM